ncbi:MAG: dienelactone hydrolase family protein [Verrucomicrobiota bacterium]
MKFWHVLVLSSFLINGLQGAMVEKAVSYKQGDTELEGYHVYAETDSLKGKRPAILVIHQWTGLTEYEKRRCRMLADQGYNVFAADIYGKGIRPQPPEAGKEAGKYKADRTLFRARIMAALDLLKADEHTDASKIAAIGYCFGGTGVLELARSGAGVAGVVSFHGSLGAAPGMAAEAGKIPAKVLVLHGADDPFSPLEEVVALEKELAAAKADSQVILYSGAVHSFTQKEAGDDNSKGAAYNETADRRSWAAMEAFFAEIFK